MPGERWNERAELHASDSFGETRMSADRFRSMPRLGLAVIGHLFLFAWFRELALWQSLEHEAWKSLRIGMVAYLILVCAASVLIRGSPPEKVAGFVLCLLPAVMLLGTLLNLANTAW